MNISSISVAHSRSYAADAPAPPPPPPPPPKTEFSAARPSPFRETIPYNIILALKQSEEKQRLQAKTTQDAQGSAKNTGDSTPPITTTQTAATQTTPVPTVQPAPTVEPLELLALELLLADAATQEMVQHFGGPLLPAPSGNPIADGIIERYGADLASRLHQLYTAMQQVQWQYLQAFEKGLNNVGPGQMGSVFSDAPEGWRFNPVVFTRAWVQSDPHVQRAWVALYGKEGLPRAMTNGGEGDGTTTWMLGEHTLHWYFPEENEGGLRPGRASLNKPRNQLNLAAPPGRIIDPHQVWFDAQCGWVTETCNFRARKFEKIFSAAIGVAAAALGGVAASSVFATAGAVTQGIAAGAAVSAMGQLVANGRINFKNLLASALAAGVGVAATRIPSAGQYLGSSSTTATFSQRLLHHTGKATLQGAIQEVLGGKFRDDITHSLMLSVAGEVGAHLNAQISRMHDLSQSQTSALRLLVRATESALRTAVDPQDPGYAFAQDFLGSMLGETLQEHMARQDAANTKTVEASKKVESDPRSRMTYDDSVVRDDPNSIDIASLHGKELAERAERGFDLMTEKMRSSHHKILAKEVYFRPDGEGKDYIRIDEVYIGEKDGKLVFGEAKTGNADLKKNQKTGLPAKEKMFFNP